MIDESKIQNRKSKMGGRFRPTYWHGRIKYKMTVNSEQKTISGKKREERLYE